MPTWSICAIQNTEPMSANENGKATAPAEENARRRKYSSGIIGTGARRSQNTNAAIRAAPASRAPITSPLPHRRTGPGPAPRPGRAARG